MFESNETVDQENKLLLMFVFLVIFSGFALLYRLVLSFSNGINKICIFWLWHYLTADAFRHSMCLLPDPNRSR